MRKAMCILEFLFFMIFLGGASSTTGNELYNQEEFKHLCKILRVAEGEPPEIPDELGKFLETRKILEKLLHATKTSMTTYQKVIQLKSSDKEDAEFVSYTVKRRIANEKIKHAMEKVKDVYNRMEEELIQAKKERTLARNNLVHAIYGVQVGELPEKKDIEEVLKNVSRSSISNKDGGLKKVKYNTEAPTNPTCGKTGDNGPGLTLINDFYCLCVGKDNAKAVCDKAIAGPCCCCCKDCSKDCKCDKPCNCNNNCNCKDSCKNCKLHNKWLSLFDTSNNTILGLENGWPLIREVCNETSTEQINTTAESIQEVLDDFNKLLGNSSKKNEITPQNNPNVESRRLFVLGYTKKMDGQGCNGNGGDEGVCVNYWSVSNLGIGIVWQNYMLEAQKHLQEMDKHIKKALRLSTMIQKLKESAEESYWNSGHSSLLWSKDYGFKGQTFFNFFIFFVFFL
ncbi:Variant surface glycoprotein [Trypanosoma congolense IL3000]|uniref:Variant surface glycoprotein n=1 Tax=Trypanosoma congolense (strain IL3000) TaxID=1068625 RepID=F9W9D9_TRYCI|nr:Variant surface glycoprotein [Trypanosoma congolense IL3000]